MYLSIFDSGEKVAAEGLGIEPASLYCAFEQVTDERKKKGKRYPLPLLLTLLMLGKLAGETTINGIVDWIKERQEWLRWQLNWPKRFPTNSTYSEALARCDAEQTVTVVTNVLLKARAVEQCGSEPSRLLAYTQEETLTHVAMDGKTLCGTLGHQREGQPPVHLLSLYECQSGIVLTQRAVQSKENEISAAAALIQPALVKGRIISPDAMHTQKRWCPCVHGFGGYYLTIENRLHYRCDVTLGEDACQVRLSGAPQALAALNGGVLALMDWLQVPNVASQMRHFCVHPLEALHLLYHKLLR